MVSKRNLIFVREAAVLFVLLTSASAQLVGNFSFSQPVNLPEDPAVERKLAEIRAQSASTCSVVSSPRGPFITQKKGRDRNFWVYYDGTSDLRYATNNFYHLNVSCMDNTGVGRSDADLFVYIQPNLPPVIADYPHYSTTLDVNNFQYPTATVYQVSATDPEGEQISYSLTSQQPSIGLFSFDSQNKIKVTRDLRSVSEPSFILAFSISDGKNTVDNFKVLVTLINMNTPPAIRNLPSAVSIPENTPGVTSLIKLSVIDDTPYSGSLVPTCTTFPTSDSSKFQFSSGSPNITISAIEQLDYEARDSYIISCSVTDGFLSSDGLDELTINVENVIEGLAFNSKDYYCKLSEGVIRENYCTLPVSVTDYDEYALQFVKFEASPESDKFFYDSKTKNVHVNVNYDVDNGLMPTGVDLPLKATDLAGSTAAATVHITIIEANDNGCKFDKDVSYIKVDQFTQLGTLDAFVVTDGDASSPNNAVEVQIVSSTPPDAGNYISVSDKGVVSYVDNIPPAKSGSSYVIAIRCKDGGVPSKTSLATVMVSFTLLATSRFTSSTVYTTATKPEKDIWDYDWFVAVFSLLMITLIAALAAAIAYLVYRFYCKKSWATKETQGNKVSPSGNERNETQSRSYNDDYDEDYFATSVRSGYNYGHSWHNGPMISLRQIPGLEYK